MLIEKNKAEMQSKFLEIENNIKKWLHTNFSTLKEGNFKKSEARENEDECIENGEEADASTHFLRIQNNQLRDTPMLYQYLDSIEFNPYLLKNVGLDFIGTF